MRQFIVLASFLAIAIALPVETQDKQHIDDFEEDPEIIAEQNRNAKYQFETDIEDHINDLTNKRIEERDGLNLKGYFEYSDGYVKRTVHYVADEEGYRVVKEETESLPGPHIDLNGVAEIASRAHGTELQYTVKSEPLKQSESDEEFDEKVIKVKRVKARTARSADSARVLVV